MENLNFSSGDGFDINFFIIFSEDINIDLSMHVSNGYSLVAHIFCKGLIWNHKLCSKALFLPDFSLLCFHCHDVSLHILFI